MPCFFSLWGCKVTDSQCSLYLRSPLRLGNQTPHQWFLVSVLGIGSSVLVQGILSRAEPAHWPVRGQEQSVWCTGGLTSNRGEDVDMSLTILCPSTPLPPPPYFCLCPKSKSSLAKWQEVHWQKIRPEWNGVSHVWSICQAGREREWERERAGDNLFESSTLCRSLDLADGKKKETVRKFYPTPPWSKASRHQSRSGNNVCTAHQRVPSHFIFPT